MYHKLIYCLLLLSCFSAASASATEQNSAAEIIALEIRNLSTSVDRLTQLIYQQKQQQQQDAILRKLDIAVAYLNFRSRRIEMLEQDKQNSQTVKTRLEDIISQLEARAEQLEESDVEDNESRKNARSETKEQLKMLKQRLARVDETLIDYDNQIVELRNQLDDVESFVERHLEL